MRRFSVEIHYQVNLKNPLRFSADVSGTERLQKHEVVYMDTAFVLNIVKRCWFVKKLVRGHLYGCNFIRM